MARCPLRTPKMTRAPASTSHDNHSPADTLVTGVSEPRSVHAAKRFDSSRSREVGAKPTGSGRSGGASAVGALTTTAEEERTGSGGQSASGNHDGSTGPTGVSHAIGLDDRSRARRHWALLLGRADDGV